MLPVKKTYGSLIFLLFFMFSAHGAVADIYRYKDGNGVWHFSNVKWGKEYRLYMRTSPPKPIERKKKYDNIITHASEKFGVEPSLIKAVIRAESDFDYQAVSHKGAKGLMQLMPETAEAMSVKDPFDPEANILGGTRYLSELLKRFKDDMKLAIAAYNAGPEKVENTKGVPAIRDTQDYVKKVLKYHRRYSSGGQ